MSSTKDPDWLAKIDAREQAATKGPWSTLSTLAGRVWVYAKGSPLLQPLRFLRAICGMFRLRPDSYLENWRETATARNERFWKQKEADAIFVAASRTDVPLMRDMLRLLAEALGPLLSSVESDWKGKRGCIECGVEDFDDEHGPLCPIRHGREALAAYRAGKLPEKGEPR